MTNHTCAYFRRNSQKARESNKMIPKVTDTQDFCYKNQSIAKTICFTLFQTTLSFVDSFHTNSLLAFDPEHRICVI